MRPKEARTETEICHSTREQTGLAGWVLDYTDRPRVGGYLKIRKDAVDLRGGHRSEGRARERLSVLREDPTLLRNGLRSVDVVTRDHTHHDPSVLADLNGINDVISERVLDGKERVEGQLLLMRRRVHVGRFVDGGVEVFVRESDDPEGVGGPLFDNVLQVPHAIRGELGGAAVGFGFADTVSENSLPGTLREPEREGRG